MKLDLYELYKKTFEEGREVRGRAINKPWEEHFMFFCLLMGVPDLPVVEIGSLNGQSSLVFADSCRRKNTQFISVDPYPNDEETKEYFASHILKAYPEVRQYNCDLTECLDKIPEKLSFVYIDGCHDFTHPDREWKALFPRIVSGGWIVIDDIEVKTDGPAKVAEYAVNNEDVQYYIDVTHTNPNYRITRFARKR